MKEVYNNCNVLYNYLCDRDDIKKCTTVITCGSSDLSVVEETANINHECHPMCFIFSGKEGKGTRGKYEHSEAYRFAEYAESFGIFNIKMILEEKSINTLQNIRYSYRIIRKNKRYIDSSFLVIVHKPYVLKRVKLICKRWGIDSKVSCLKANFRDYLKYVTSKGYMSEDDIINELVGEIFYIKHSFLFGLARNRIPSEVMDAYLFLKKKGYNRYII